ncbi:thermonuclease family protein [Qipengyuania sp. MTN3-11]|uniref:thermonuclease family protein n=1 Tax=Qipengyuania sp. MTN3-11 TaxID=3056557 RepID=UPI0036F1CFB2
MKRFVFSILALLASPQVASAQAIEGTARVIDGDTIDMTGMRVRLLHIDAPEAAQNCSRGGEPWACGTDATAALTSLLNSQTVSCIATSRDMYDRYLAICRTRIMDIGEQMVALGLAVADDDAPEEYQTAAQRAKAMKLGLWNSDFQMPREWRAANLPAYQPVRAPRSSTSTRTPSSRSYRNEAGCAIKGNRSRRGEWIYHLPGQQYYNQTRPEQLFCSEAEAQAAGYRRSKV